MKRLTALVLHGWAWFCLILFWSGVVLPYILLTLLVAGLFMGVEGLLFVAFFPKGPLWVPAILALGAAFFTLYRALYRRAQFSWVPPRDPETGRVKIVYDRTKHPTEPMLYGGITGIFLCLAAQAVLSIFWPSHYWGPVGAWHFAIIGSLFFGPPLGAITWRVLAPEQESPATLRRKTLLVCGAVQFILISLSVSQFRALLDLSFAEIQWLAAPPLVWSALLLPRALRSPSATTNDSLPPSTE
jgi:hypothetical protein